MIGYIFSASILLAIAIFWSISYEKDDISLILERVAKLEVKVEHLEGK